MFGLCFRCGSMDFDGRVWQVVPPVNSTYLLDLHCIHDMCLAPYSCLSILGEWRNCSSTVFFLSPPPGWPCERGLTGTARHFQHQPNRREIIAIIPTIIAPPTQCVSQGIGCTKIAAAANGGIFWIFSFSLCITGFLSVEETTCRCECGLRP